MDMSRVHQAKSQNMKRSRKKTSNNNTKSVKVVYISTPMKVNTCASNFRALVQQLTGQDSDMSWFPEFSDPTYMNREHKDTLMNFNAEFSAKRWECEQSQVASVSNNDSTDHENNEDVIMPVAHEIQSVGMVENPCYDYSPSSCSESLLGSFDGVVSSQIVDELEEMFPSSLFGYGSCISGGDDVYGAVQFR